MDLGDVAGLIAAIAFVILVGFMIYPLIRLGKLFDQLSQTVKDTGDQAVEALDGGVDTVQKINKTLDDVNDVSDALSTTANNVSALTDLYGAMLGKPAIKVASTVWAVRQTVGDFFKGRGHGGKKVVDSTTVDPAAAKTTSAKASAQSMASKSAARQAAAHQTSAHQASTHQASAHAVRKAGEKA
jgi:uncharacterized protein YoxC